MMKKRERARIDNAIELNGRGHGIATDASAASVYLELPPYLECTAGGSEIGNDHNTARKVPEAKVARA